MREVAWVIFDEIHYMRDKGEPGEPIRVIVPGANIDAAL